MNNPSQETLLAAVAEHDQHEARIRDRWRGMEDATKLLLALEATKMRDRQPRGIHTVIADLALQTISALSLSDAEGMKGKDDADTGS